MSLLEAVVFDLDDTLYPEREFAFSGFVAVAGAFENELGDPAESTLQMRRLFDTGDRPRVFNALLELNGHDQDQQLVDRMIQTYREHAPTISLHDDADEVLIALSGRYKLGLITDGPAKTQRSKTDALGLQERLDEIILTSALGKNFHKPHPRAFEMIAERFGVSASSCVYVADNAAKDFVAPNALGWKTVQVIRPDGIYRDTPPATNGTAEHVITTLNALEGIIG